MRMLMVAVTMVLLWAVPCPAANSGLKEGAREVGQGAKEAGREITETPGRSPKR